MSQAKAGSKKIIWLGVLAVIILIFIGGEIWWFFLRQNPAPAPQSTEILPPPQALEPLLPAQNTAENAPANAVSPANPQEPATPPVQPASGLLNYSVTTPVISLTDLTKLDSATVNEDELVKLIVRTSNPTGSATAETAAEINTVDELTASLKIKIPTAVKKEFSDEFDIFAFGGNTFDKTECARVKNTSAKCYGPRLGLAIKVLDSSRISAPLKAWEKTMTADLKPLILAKAGISATATFQTGTYQNQNIRYKNLPINTITVEYALVDNVLIITTSKSAMLKAINSASGTRNSNELGQ